MQVAPLTVVGSLTCASHVQWLASLFGVSARDPQQKVNATQPPGAQPLPNFPPHNVSQPPSNSPQTKAHLDEVLVNSQPRHSDIIDGKLETVQSYM